jgi:RES domain-containing protein
MQKFAAPKTVDLIDQNNYRIIPSHYPPINFFEDLVDPHEMEALWEIESLTNERLRQEVGDIFLVPKEDRISGPGSSIVMAAFTHIYFPSRFTDGSYGIYYASLSFATAIYETVHRREQFLNYTHETKCELMMRAYEAKICKALHDIRDPQYQNLYQEDLIPAQSFAKDLRATNSWGLVYDSVRHAGGTCIAAFRPPAISAPKELTHLRYIWDGQKITEVIDIKSVIRLG